MLDQPSEQWLCELQNPPARSCCTEAAQERPLGSDRSRGAMETSLVIIIWERNLLFRSSASVCDYTMEQFLALARRWFSTRPKIQLNSVSAANPESDAVSERAGQILLLPAGLIYGCHPS